MITVGVNLATSQAAVALAVKYGDLYAAVGIHPHEAVNASPQDMDELRRLCLHPKVIGVGETGLDWRRCLSPRQAQLDAFAAHLALAAEVDLPLIIHNREADADVLAMLRATPGVRGVLHAYSSDETTAEAAVALGFHISFAGPLTYKNAETTRRVARALPLERLLLETDCPSLPPVPYRGQRNEPAHVGLIAVELARLRETTVALIASATTHNACDLFGLPTAGAV